EIERERSVHRVAERIETRKHIQWDRRIRMPTVVLRYRYELRPRAGAIDANALRVWAKMSPSGQTISTVSTGDVSLAHDEIALCETFDVITHGIDNAYKFVTNYQRHWNRFLRPCVPVVNVHVGPADRRFKYADEHVVAANCWNGNVLEPQTWLSPRLYDSLHH